MRFSLFTLLLISSLFLFSQNNNGNKAAAMQALSDQGGTWTATADRYQSLQFATPLPTGEEDATLAAKQFLAQYGVAISATDAELLPLRQQTAANGHTYLRFQQTKGGVPVLGAELTVAVTPSGGITGLKSSLRSEAEFVASSTSAASTTAPYPAGKAAEAIIDLALHAAQWQVLPQEQVWISANPWDAGSVAELTNIYDVNEPGGYRSYRVYLGASSGKTVFRHPLHCDLDRTLYHTTTSNPPVWIEGNNFPGNLDAEDQEIITATEEIYNLMNRTFGRTGYNGTDGSMRLITRRSGSCPNASASRDYIFHCPGTVTDDIVAHEWTHNYTGSMNGLIYYYQSGAINEGLSDVFGESVDLLNNRGGGNQTSARTQCNDARVRWQMGEDATAFGGAIRDMWNPECKGDPSSKSSDSYWCGSGDNGGVHINSGLVNQTYSLLVDGGTLNNVTVSPIGMTKALHIYFHASNVYMTSVTDFYALGDMLISSANDLAGTNLPALTLVDLPAAASGDIITAADIQQVRNAVAATQLQMDVPCTGQPTLEQNPPAICANTTIPQEQMLLEQDWENGLNGWTVSQIASNPSTWDDKGWELDDNLPNGRPGQGLFAINPRVGDCQGDLDNGAVNLTSPFIDIPPNGDDTRLRFNHYYSIEQNYDGGILYVSRNGSAFQYIDNSAFLYNGYDVFLVGPNGNDNPAAGLGAFNGSDQNSTAGTWGTSLVDLSAAGVQPGDRIKLRWSMTHDGCNGWLGWYLDEVRVSFCGEAEALPVTYEDFEATVEKSHLKLKWSTDNEEQNAGFHVERSENGSDQFTTLGFVAPSGLATGEYEYPDRAVSAGVNYVYRLRQTDLDGAVNYSPLVSATLASDANHLVVYPNPVASVLTVRTDAQYKVARLYDTAGRLVLSADLRAGAGELPAGELAAGVYLLRVGEKVVRVVRR